MVLRALAMEQVLAYLLFIIPGQSFEIHYHAYMHARHLGELINMINSCVGSERK
jgi:hypothetical protein